MWNATREDDSILIRRLNRAVASGYPVTIRYTKVDAVEPDLRTIEPYEVLETKNGNMIVVAMDRRTRERRTFRLDRIDLYQVHRGATFQVPRTEDHLNSMDDRSNTWVICGKGRREVARVVALTPAECHHLALQDSRVTYLLKTEGSFTVRRLRYRELVH